MDNLDQFVDVDFVRTAPASSNSTAVGIDSLKSVINGFRTAFPDLKVTIDDVIYGANSTSITWTVTGTNTGHGKQNLNLRATPRPADNPRGTPLATDDPLDRRKT